MKRLILVAVYALLLMSTTLSCKKEKEDARDIFVGTWTGILFFSRIGTEYPVTVTISKSTTNSSQILIGQNKATVNGSSYTYVKFVSNIGIVGNYTGTGSINGNELTESGLITSDGAPFEGNLGEWFRHLSKQ
jgi:hypothetical protein